VKGRSCLVLPGYGGSGPEHWQSRWERERPGFSRVEQADWDHPDLEAWIPRLAAAVTGARPPVILVAHSLACLLVAHWSSRARPEALARVEGAFLVAPVDPAGPVFPAEARSFAPVPGARLPFPSLVVASADDPYAAPEFARACASAWGSRLVEIGARGHINAASGLGVWEDGLELLATLMPT
jgi:uncharacterized protein